MILKLHVDYDDALMTNVPCAQSARWGVSQDSYSEYVTLTTSYDFQTIEILRDLLPPKQSTPKTVPVYGSLPVPGLRYLKQRIMDLVYKEHYKTPYNNCSLYTHASRLLTFDLDAPSNIDNPGTENVANVSYRVRIVSLMLQLLKTGAIKQNWHGNPEEFKLYTKQQVLDPIKKLNTFMAIEVGDWPEHDPALCCHLQYFQRMECYYILDEGIRTADLGLIRHAVDRHLYQYKSCVNQDGLTEFLFFKIVTYTAVDEKSRRALLANLLVNLSGKREEWFEADNLLLAACVTEHKYGKLDKGLIKKTADVLALRDRPISYRRA
ncbi:hypothetical protein TRICI_004950 [Trichomonascus ciferrii]|uniref:DUF6589 domain-containing protein n=1 Tax=Trichomonascus ciferrii TaxID=44093 RepID=A0A642UY35_9ASCO|nr:hypothetical protein TRICI_004950 [Trichomonascus ciferrii]